MKRGGRFQRVAIFFSIFALGSLALVLGAGAQSDKAQEKPWERFSLNLGGFVTSFNTDVTIGVRNAGIAVDVEEGLGLDSNMTAIPGGCHLPPRRQPPAPVGFRLHAT